MAQVSDFYEQMSQVASTGGRQLRRAALVRVLLTRDNRQQEPDKRLRRSV